MGVLSCSRPSCDKIMCDTYVNSVGYVCFECQEEFKNYLSSRNIDASSHNKIIHALEKFMETDKGDFDKDKNKEMSVEQFFGGYTKKD